MLNSMCPSNKQFSILKPGLRISDSCVEPGSVLKCHTNYSLVRQCPLCSLLYISTRDSDSCVEPECWGPTDTRESREGPRHSHSEPEPGPRSLVWTPELGDSERGYKENIVWCHY